ncbi:MAG: cellulase family glycosylhydrolase [Polyangiaceae bacterium]
MQSLYDAVRATGANNLVLIGGLDWAYSLQGVPAHRIQGFNIVYVTHPYNYPGKQPGDWDNDWGFLTATDPVMVTEFGSFDCSTWYYEQIFRT